MDIFELIKKDGSPNGVEARALRLEFEKQVLALISAGYDIDDYYDDNPEIVPLERLVSDIGDRIRALAVESLEACRAHATANFYFAHDADFSVYSDNAVSFNGAVFCGDFVKRLREYWRALEERRSDDQRVRCLSTRTLMRSGLTAEKLRQLAARNAAGP